MVILSLIDVVKQCLSCDEGVLVFKEVKVFFKWQYQQHSL